jgi:superfamily II DNA or RNA helicase
MNLKQIMIKKSYSSDNDDILNDFYIPALETSVKYYRLAGFFSSTSLAIASRGILGLIRNEGYIKLIVSPKLKKVDLDVIISSNEDPSYYIEQQLLLELDNLENEIIRDHVFALGWLLANKKLEIKVAIPIGENKTLRSYEESDFIGLFHQKVGILMDDENNIVTFSGSINETALGWKGNVEEFKVFRNWELSELEYVTSDINKFERFWNGKSDKIRTINIPDAVSRKLISLAPADINEIDFIKPKISNKNGIILFEHQKDAIRSWITNGMKGIFEMATGTGKTFTALGCLAHLFDSNKSITVVITAPYHHLLQQWNNEITKFGLKCDQTIIADSSNNQWKDTLVNSLIDLHLGHKKKIIILTTHNTLSSSDFKNIIGNNLNDSKLLIIADEVHGLGAKKSQTGLLNEFEYRLGLSATPKRWYDTLGTNVIYDYFGGVVYEFGLEKAITSINPVTNETYLVPYKYRLNFLSLTADEIEKYIENTAKIIKQKSRAKTESEEDKYLELLYYQRANIIKNAKEKYTILNNILGELTPNLKWTIIYCSPQQIENIMKIIFNKGIISHRFTMAEGIRPKNEYQGLSEREYVLNKFAESKYQVLIAMKCLDEGVDIPPAREAVLMASSSNPREYIQRIGRVIRRYKGKREATIYDFLIIPSFNQLPLELMKIEWNIFNKELIRCEEIGKIALNKVQALNSIYEIKNKYLEDLK